MDVSFVLMIVKFVMNYACQNIKEHIQISKNGDSFLCLSSYKE
jgi:hypothetical protein